MKKIQLLVLTILSLCYLSCSSSDDNDNSKTNVLGTIQLSGDDTAMVGTSLTVGNINLDGLTSTGTTKSVTLLDENTTINGNEVNSNNGATNGFVIVATQFNTEDNAAVDKVISMVIVKNSTEYRYVCSTPPTTSAYDTDCGSGFSVDKTKKEVVFNNTTVINTTSGKILTMNGTITW